MAGSIEPITKIHKDDAPSYRSELLKLHKDLVSISSVSGAEENVGRWLVKYLAGKGYKTAYQPVPARETTPEGEDRYNIIAWYGPQEPTPKVLVTSHIDVVPPYIPYGINSEHPSKDTVITGRGSVDAKGSVAAMITALEELRSRDAASNLEDVMLVFVVGEEVAGEGMRVFSESLRQMDPPATFSAVIFGEPTENKLACGHKGGLFCDLYAKGTGGHSGYPWLGKSANELLIRALAKIVETDLGSSERFGNTTVNVGTLDGGVAANVIPENAKAGIAARVAIGPEKEGAQVVKKRMEAILKEVDEEAFRLECSGMYGFVECDCDVDGKSSTSPPSRKGSLEMV